MFYNFKQIRRDKIGVLTSVVVNRQKVEQNTYTKEISNISFYKKKTSLELSLIKWTGNPCILRDYHFWDLGSPNAYRVVCSPKFKSILEKQKLPPHKFYPAEIDVLGKIHNYFVLHYIQDYLQDIDYKKTQFRKAEILETEPIKKEFKIGEIKNYAEYQKLEQKAFKKDNWLYPIKLHFKDNIYYDIWGFQGTHIISQKAKEIFEKENITGIETKELSKTEFSYLNIVMPPPTRGV